MNGDLLSFLQEENSWKLLIFMLIIAIFWIVFIYLLLRVFPRKYQFYRREIFFFLVTLNIALLFMGMLLTASLLLFGLYWATFRMSKPVFEVINFEQYFTKIPLVESKFHEGVLSLNGHKDGEIKTEEMIKSLETIYESADQNNIGQVKQFLSSNTDEVRLIAFSQISSYEKLLTKKPKELELRLSRAKSKEEREECNYLLAETYWQFIFHGVADTHLIGFYIGKIERHLKLSGRNLNVYILYGKVHLYNKKYEVAKECFLEALKCGVPKHLVYSYLAEIEYELRNFNNVAQYISNDMFDLDLKIKPYHMIWGN
jgi:hypothetical protein